MIPRFCFLLVALFMARTGFAGEIKFSDVLISGDAGAAVVIQVPDDSTLIFNGGDYSLRGKNLIIRAKNVRLSGKVSISSFAKDSTPANYPNTAANVPQAIGVVDGCVRRGTGCAGHAGANGNDGAKGHVGLPSGRIALLIENITREPSASISFSFRGQKGGKGQTGGQGGQGATGEDGEHQVGAPHCSGPYDGGPGGVGGVPGAGGSGGDGGAGAQVTIPAGLQAFLKSSSSWASLDLSGGSGGDPGDSGSAGVGGPGGGGGNTANTCVGASNASPGAGGPNSSSGPVHAPSESVDGPPGKLIVK